MKLRRNSFIDTIGITIGQTRPFRQLKRLQFLCWDIYT